MALGKLTFLCLNTACIGVLGLLIIMMLLRVNSGRDEHTAGGKQRNRFGSSYLFRQDHPYVEWMETEVPYSPNRAEEEREREGT